MKRIIYFFVVFFVCCISCIAQKSERDLLIDSLTTLCLKSQGRLQFISNVQKICDKSSEVDPIVLEAGLYNITRKYLAKNLSESYSTFTNSQLKDVARFMTSESYQRINSEEVKSVMGELLRERLMAEIEGSSGKTKLHQLNDKEYDELVDRYLELINAKQAMNAILKPMFDLIKEQIHNREAVKYLSIIEKNLYKDFPLCFKHALVDYVTKQHLREAVDFYSQLNVQQSTTNSMNSLMENMMSDVAGVLEELKPYLKKIDVMRDTSAIAVDVKAYIEFLSMSDVPLLTNLEPSYPMQTLSLKKKASYTGQTRDGLPHGKGVLTDAKGIRYSGQYANGKRHGLITTIYVNGDSITEMWANDKVLGEQNTSVDKLAPRVDGVSMGYGYKYKGGNKYIGTFVDDKLEGEGSAFLSGVTLTGFFKNGSMTKGRIVDTSTPGVNVDFEGDVISDAHNLWSGQMLVHNSKNNEHIIKNGKFLSRQLYGDGTCSVVDKSNNVSQQDSGYFAYDRLYGDGKRVTSITEDGDKLMYSYVGEFFAGKPQGKGVLVMEKKRKGEAASSVETIEGYFLDGDLDGEFVRVEEISNLILSDYEYVKISRYGQSIHFGFFRPGSKEPKPTTLTITTKGSVSGDKLYGDCEITASNGVFYKGIFKNGSLINGTMRRYDENGIMRTYNVKHGISQVVSSK